MASSRFPGFYKLSLAERRKRLQELLGLPGDALAVLDDGGLSMDSSDNMVENVLGRYALPYAIGLNFLIDERDFVVPMVIEEPSVVAAASNAARMIREGGGFRTQVSDPVMIGQIQLLDLCDASEAARRIKADEKELLAVVEEAMPSLVQRGGGPRALHTRILREASGREEKGGDGILVVHLHLDVCDAMGANMVNTAAETLAPVLAERTGARAGLRILSNLATERRVCVETTVPDKALDSQHGAQIRTAIAEASEFAELDPYRAATHNKGIMNGIDAVMLATANDWRSVEAGAHAYAAQEGGYRPLAVWRSAGETLQGRLELPMAVGTVGGSLQMHEAAKLSLQLLQTESAQVLASVAASVGMACNLAALRALATEGIQRGHMALHSRIVAHSQAKAPGVQQTSPTKENP